MELFTDNATGLFDDTRRRLSEGEGVTPIDVMEGRNVDEVDDADDDEVAEETGIASGCAGTEATKVGSLLLLLVPLIVMLWRRTDAEEIGRTDEVPDKVRWICRSVGEGDGSVAILLTSIEIG